MCAAPLGRYGGGQVFLVVLPVSILILTLKNWGLLVNTLGHVHL